MANFFDMLSSLGLFGGGQQPQQAAPNPYGLDPDVLQQVQRQNQMDQSLRLLAMGMKMPAGDRTQMLANWTPGADQQRGMYNAAQLQILKANQLKATQATQQEAAAREQLREALKNEPPGKRRNAAMFFIQAGDLGKAAEVLFGGGERSAMQEKIDALVQTGVPEPTAAGIVNGRYSVQTSPYDGSTKIIDIATGTAVNPSTPGAPAIAPQTTQPIPQPIQNDISIDQLTGGTGGVKSREEAEKLRVQNRNEKRINAEGALGFLTKVSQTEKRLTGMNDSDFGPIQGENTGWLGGVNTAVKGVTDWWNTDNSLARQGTFRRDLADLELDVAKMKLKGQGTVTENERMIARQTLGGLTSPDKETQQKALNATKLEAAVTIRDAIQAGVLTMDDLVRRGINPDDVVSLLSQAGLLDTGGPDTPVSTNGITIRRVK